MTLEEAIRELLYQRQLDQDRRIGMRNGGDVKQKYERKGKQLAEYHMGRECAFTEAITLLEKVGK